MVEIVGVEPTDRDQLREFWLAECEAQAHGRPYAVLRTFEERLMVGEPHPYYRTVLLAGRLGDAVVGTAGIGVGLRDNPHLAHVDLGVVPSHRRQGVGTALLDAVLRWCREHKRTTLLGEVAVPVGTDPARAASYAFAVSRGFTSVQLDDHLLLRLPATPGGAVEVPGYEVLTWRDRCPDQYVVPFCTMRSQMSQDVPTGEIDMEPIVVDVDRLRTLEARTARIYHSVVSAARAADGSFAGYSIVYLPHDGDVVVQDDTLVMPEHRGHRLGTALKLANLAVVQREHRERTSLHTWTASDNLPMQRTNRDFGFTPVERIHEMQGTV
jgi:GNAT superfamily N-acetyltransferase